jgi:hypothetical protein
MMRYQQKADAVSKAMAAARPHEICSVCRQPAIDHRHGHPHDYVGSLAAFDAGHVCLACNKIHDNQPSISRLWR